jgi:deazaflavin-dependent oxidoreductase (nitroreductase family)
MATGDTMDWNSWNAQVITEFRENDGQVEAFDGKPLILLHTVGAKSGVPRINPLMYDTEGDRLYVFASMGGAPRHPDWYHNVKAHPKVTVEFPDTKKHMIAEELSRPERDARYRQMAERFPQFADYENNTDRLIPVVELRPK